MQATVTSKEFKQALGKLALLPGAKDRTVMLRTVPGALFAEVAGGGSFLSVRLDADVKADGKVAVDGEALSGLMPPAPQLTLTAQGGGKLSFKSGKLSGTTAQFQDGRLDALDGQRPRIEAAYDTTIKVPELIRALRTTRINPSTPNPSHGTRVVVRDGHFLVCCSDVFRAALLRTRSDGFIGDFEMFLNIDFINNLLGYADVVEAKLAVQGGVLRLEAGNVSATIPLIQQRKTDQVAKFIDGLDYKSSTGLRLPVRELKSCLTSTNSIIGGNSYDSRLKLSLVGKQLSMSAESSRGSAVSDYELVDQPSRTFGAGDFTVVLSIRYLAELIDMYGHDIIDMYVWKNLVQLESPDRTYTSIMPTVVV